MHTDDLAAGVSPAWRYYEWRREPDWPVGVGFQWDPPAAGTVSVDASVTPVQDDPLYDVVVDVAARSAAGTQLVRAPFQHVRVQASVAGARVRVRHTGSLREVNAAGEAV